jgi:hypothetical protein
MAYGINAPLGLIPHSYLNGQPYTGAMTSYPLLSGTQGNIFIGDPVVINPSTGAIRRLAINTTTGTDLSVELAASTAIPIFGVFMGCKYQAYVNGVLEVVRSPYWIGGTQTFPAGGANASVVGIPAEAMIVVADPQLLFDIQVSTSMTSLAGTTLATTYAGAASSIIGQNLTLGIGITNGSASGLIGNAIPTNTVYYSNTGAPVLPNPLTGNMATHASAFYADLGAAAGGATGTGVASGAKYHLKVMALTPRVDQVVYPNLGSGFASSVCQNNTTTPASVKPGSFNNVLVQINYSGAAGSI